MKVILAGGSGFIGRATLQQLRARGHDVVVLGRTRPRPSDASCPDASCSDASCSDAPCSEDVPDGGWVRWDAADGPPPTETLANADAVVNLVGIAFPSGRNTFERAHVDAVDHLVAAARSAGVPRFVHISVTDVPHTRGPYRESKRAGEQRLANAPLDVTILRPGLVYGEGDVMLTQLVRFIRLAPAFFVPRGALGALQVVDVHDVATAIVAAVEHANLPQPVYDVVGPERLTLRELIARTARALELPTVCIPLPRWLMRTQAALLTKLGWPLITPSQLGMLIDGLYGDPEPARRDLGLVAKPMTHARIAELASRVDGPPMRLRLVTDAAHRDWLRAQGHGLWKVQLPVVLALMLALPFVISDVWVRLGLIYALTSAWTLLGLRRKVASWLHPNLRAVCVGAGIGVVMAAIAWPSMLVLAKLIPSFSQQLASVTDWVDGYSPWLWLPALVLIAAAEDLLWRGSIGLGSSARFGPWLGALLTGFAFALAHVTMGPPILWLAAALAGAFWSLVTARSRNLATTITSHVVFDLLVLALVLA